MSDTHRLPVFFGDLAESNMMARENGGLNSFRYAPFAAYLTEWPVDVVEQWQPIVGAKADKIVVRRMKTKWGGT